MRIALVQQHAGVNIEDNVMRGIQAVRAAADRGAQCVCFAELAFTPFYPQNPAGANVGDLAEPVPGRTTDRFCEVARACNIVVVINLFERDGEQLYDSSPVINADGTLLGTTHMVHVADLPGFHEKGYYAPGATGAPVYETAAGRVGVAICYDRHFPEYMRAMGLKRPDVVFVPQAGSVDEWPDGLYEAELRVAAFQNGYHVALCNRVGQEEKLEFAGESFVCGPDGKVVARAPKGRDQILIADIDPAESERSHARRLFLKDRRPDLYADWLA